MQLLLHCSVFLKRRFCFFDFTFYLSVYSTIKRKGTFCGLFSHSLATFHCNKNLGFIDRLLKMEYTLTRLKARYWPFKVNLAIFPHQTLSLCWWSVCFSSFCKKRLVCTVSDPNWEAKAAASCELCLSFHFGSVEQVILIELKNKQICYLAV